MFDEYAILRSRAVEMDELTRRTARQLGRRRVGTAWFRTIDRSRAASRRTR